jgi:hypothetical protein
VILDTKRNIFGGFTPVEWDSRITFKADDSQKSFVFTLKNPHNIPARRFALKAEKKHQAIYCDFRYGPWFGDIRVSDNCNANTGLDGRIVFTGSEYFQVTEIEVFEIAA